jgi:hypothetical protein
MEPKGSRSCSEELDHILSQLIPLHIVAHCSFKIQFKKFSYLLQHLSRGLFASGVPTKIVYTSVSFVRAACHAYLIFRNFITLIMFGEYEVCKFSDSLVTGKYIVNVFTPLTLHADISQKYSTSMELR